MTAEFPRRGTAALFKQGGCGVPFHVDDKGGRFFEAQRKCSQWHAEEGSQTAMDGSTKWWVKAQIPW